MYTGSVEQTSITEQKHIHACNEQFVIAYLNLYFYTLHTLIVYNILRLYFFLNRFYTPVATILAEFKKIIKLEYRSRCNLRVSSAILHVHFIYIKLLERNSYKITPQHHQLFKRRR